jgi:hypothetical protein
MEVGFATGDQVEQQVRPRDTLPLGLYRYPLYQDPFDRYGTGRWWGGGRLWLTERVGSRWQRHRVQPLLNDERLQWVGCAGNRDLSWW